MGLDREQQGTESILGYPVTTMTIDQCIDCIGGWLAATTRPKTFCCANPHSLVLAGDDPLFQESLRQADLLTPDGTGIVLASRILGGTIRQRVTGSDIFWGLSEALNRAGGKRYFFLGASAATLAAIQTKMAGEYPGIIFAGAYSPPFASDFSAAENQAMVDAINAAAPDVLWVGMTAPKQEKWIHQHRDQLKVPFIGAVGAVFDFYVGKVKRSHPLFQKYGLEWLPRLLQEPRRLFRRNFISSPLFLYQVCRQWWQRSETK